MQRNHRRRASVWAAAIMLATAAEAADYGLPLTGEAAEAFLRNASVIARKPIGVGITRPDKVTLSDGTRTHYAVWKTVDDFRIGLKQGRRGGFQLGVRDSYEYEIAAYELDKILGLGMVPRQSSARLTGARAPSSCG
jgi:hypothetical protein